MTSLKLIGAVTLALSVAAPAVAMPQRDHGRYSYSHRMSPVQHARSLSYGSYGFDRGNDFDRGNYSDSFERRNTFN